jgi:hypothetical protein
LWRPELLVAAYRLEEIILLFVKCWDVFSLFLETFTRPQRLLKLPVLFVLIFDEIDILSLLVV